MGLLGMNDRLLAQTCFGIKLRVLESTVKHLANVLLFASALACGCSGTKPRESSVAMATNTAHVHTSRLAREKSPYLLQHQHNPVDWFAWGEEAFQKARSENKPIFLSIGYSTCHWCHVMERESFENDAVAAFLNAHFEIGRAHV